ncbi:MAG: glycosyltransferase family 39 protein [Paracoccaceae bacterium]
MSRLSESGNWFARTLILVAAITAARLVLLAFNRTDLFVDESQYWLWGQNLDFGYYSKPPLIGWVIRAVTDLAGSDSPFWVRAPGAVLHAATALILAALANRQFGPRAAFWTGLSYVTVPFATVGSLLMSTDTIMAPCYAAALYFWFALSETRRPAFAFLAGVTIGAAFLAKYAAVYFLLGAALAAILVPALRIGWRNLALFLLAFALTISPNVVWNLTHDLTTVSHTMDNVGWVREDDTTSSLSLSRMLEFIVGQFAVVGPVLFAALLLSLVRSKLSDNQRALLAFALPVLAIVTVQAFLSKAYANWAVATYFPGVLVAVSWLIGRYPRLLSASLAIAAVIAVAIPVLTTIAPAPERNGAPLLKRYLGRADLSRQVIQAAKANGAGAVFVADRDMLADLFYTGADASLNFYAPRPVGRPHNYYEQMYAYPDDAGPTLFVLTAAPTCAGKPVEPVTTFDTTGGAYAKYDIGAYILPTGCTIGAP